MAATAKEALYSLINAENDTSFNAINTTMSAPETINDPQITTRNTTVVLSGNPAQGKTGAVRFYYNRVDIGAFAGPEPIELEWGGELRIHDLIPKINAALNINLQEDDVVDSGLPDREQLFTSFALVVKYDSYGWTGQFTLNLQVPPVDVGDEGGGGDLDGLDGGDLT